MCSMLQNVKRYFKNMIMYEENVNIVKNLQRPFQNQLFFL